MPGFTLSLTAPSSDAPSLEHDCLPASGSTVTVRSFSGPTHYLRTALFARYSRHCVAAENEEGLFVLDGALLNMTDLQTRYGGAELLVLAQNMRRRLGRAFFKEFRGEFAGAYFDKASASWVVFTNHSGSKPLFYHAAGPVLVCASSLPCLARVLRHYQVPCRLDQVGAYFLLTHGYMLGDYTLIQEVKKLTAGDYLSYENGRSTVGSYYKANNEPRSQLTREAALQEIDDCLLMSARRGFEFDRTYGHQSICAISAGLDCRMTTFAAARLGYENVLQLNYAQSGSRDERYPREMSAALGREMLFFPLDRGTYLTRTIDGMFEANGGLIIYAGASHTFSICRHVRFDRLGLYHSGILGGALFGAYLSGPKHTAPRPGMGAYSMKLLARVHQEEARIAERFANAEMYRLYNRGFNGIHNGTFVGNLFTYMHSPALMPECLDTMLTVPPGLRSDGSLRVDYLCRFHPEGAAQRWGETGLSVQASNRFTWPLKFIKRVQAKLFPASTMNPMDYWYATNSRLPRYCENFFKTHIECLAAYPELQQDARMLFTTGRFAEKALVLTLLRAVGRYFGESPGKEPEEEANLGGVNAAWAGDQAPG
ncbi:MAG: hypothetical protein HS113_26750 [Verrucomicrobiales bacterium]|nr:hypothetical protein [Verrucomicrobiales bacterium]